MHTEVRSAPGHGSPRGRSHACPSKVNFLYAFTMTPPKKKAGRPLLFPARVLVYVTNEARADLDTVAKATDRTVPELVRQFIREGLERAKQGEA